MATAFFTQHLFACRLQKHRLKPNTFVKIFVHRPLLSGSISRTAHQNKANPGLIFAIQQLLVLAKKMPVNPIKNNLFNYIIK